MTQRVSGVLGVASMRAGVPPPPRQMLVSPLEWMPSTPFLPGAHPLPLLTLVALRRLSLTLSRVPERATMDSRAELNGRHHFLHPSAPWLCTSATTSPS
jgi:hypothetical protein